MAGRPVTDPSERAQASRLAQQLRTLREQRGWTRERMAKEAGIHTRTLVRLESESAVQPSFFTVAALAEALDTSLDDLYSLATHGPGLWSIGYEGQDIDSFVASLTGSGVETVADVRLTPISRKRGFSKTRLGEALGEAGVAYRHFRNLGNPKSNRAPFWEGRVSEGMAVFEQLMDSEAAREAISQLADLAQHSRVAVMCFEQDQAYCHRQVILQMVQEQVSVPVTALP